MTSDFTGQVVIVTGAGRGLGRRYALDLGAAGARVVVHARRRDAAEDVVGEIRRGGGTAVAAVGDARDGDVLASTALRELGRIDALVVNAGITRDRSFARTTPDDWAEVLDVHLGGAYAGCAAVWPHLTGQGSGAIVLTTSGAGLHGNFGQAGYAAAKAGVIGLAKSLAIEGGRKGVRVNAVAPMALTDMTRDVFGDGPPSALAPEAVSPVVLALAHPSCPLTGEVVETGGGWASLLRWERSAGVRFPPGALTPGAVAARWPDIARFDHTADHPRTTADSLAAACTPAPSGGTP